jgi:uncharacterized protein (TIGR00251 family)
VSLFAGVRELSDGVTIAVRVTPRASKTAITGVMGEGAEAVLKIALAAPPVDGRANQELIDYFAEVFDISRSSVEIASGQQSRNKVVKVKGRTASEVSSILSKFFS